MDLRTARQPRCDCGDHLWRERVCKHILAALLREGDERVLSRRRRPGPHGLRAPPGARPEPLSGAPPPPPGGTYRARGRWSTSGQPPRADVLAEGDQEAVDLHPVALAGASPPAPPSSAPGSARATYPQRLVTRCTWTSTPMRGWPHAIPSTRLAHFGPTPRKARSTSRSQGSSPPCSSTTRRAISRICAALRLVEGAGADQRVELRGREAPASPPGCGRARRGPRATAIITSSRVRIERMHATSCSKARVEALVGQLEERRLGEGLHRLRGAAGRPGEVEGALGHGGRGTRGVPEAARRARLAPRTPGRSLGPRAAHGRVALALSAALADHHPLRVGTVARSGVFVSCCRDSGMPATFWPRVARALVDAVVGQPRRVEVGPAVRARPRSPPRANISSPMRVLVLDLLRVEGRVHVSLLRHALLLVWIAGMLRVRVVSRSLHG